MPCFETSLGRHPRLTEVALPDWQSQGLATPAISLNPEVHYQQHIGLGGAFTEAAALNYQALTPAAQLEFMTAYFHPDQGSAYNFCRIHLNSCDFALGNWACQDTPEGAFSISHYERAILPMIRDAQAMLGAKIRLMVSPWSPPAYMKTNGQMNLGGELKPEFQAQWASHYVQFIQALQALDFDIWGLSVQNEPEATQTWDSCLYSPEQERDFIGGYLGPALHAAGLADIRVVCWDHNRDNLYLRASVILSDPIAAQYVWGSGFHWYMDDCFDNVQAVHDAFPDKHLIFTEGCQEGGPHHGEWAVAERYGRSIINDFRHWTRGWLDWNLLLDNQGGPNHVGNLCSAPMLSTPEGDQFVIQPSFYYLQHLSPRFIPHGSVRILSASATDSLLTVAFSRPDGQITLVVMNDSDQDRPCHIRLRGRTLPGLCPAHAMQTYLL